MHPDYSRYITYSAPHIVPEQIVEWTQPYTNAIGFIDTLDRNYVPPLQFEVYDREAHRHTIAAQFRDLVRRSECRAVVLRVGDIVEFKWRWETEPRIKVFLGESHDDAEYFQFFCPGETEFPSPLQYIVNSELLVGRLIEER